MEQVHIRVLLISCITVALISAQTCNQCTRFNSEECCNRSGLQRCCNLNQRNGTCSTRQGLISNCQFYCYADGQCPPNYKCCPSSRRVCIPSNFCNREITTTQPEGQRSEASTQTEELETEASTQTEELETEASTQSEEELKAEVSTQLSEVIDNVIEEDVVISGVPSNGSILVSADKRNKRQVVSEGCPTSLPVSAMNSLIQNCVSDGQCESGCCCPLPLHSGCCVPYESRK